MTTAHDGGRLSALCIGRLYPQEMLLVLISVRGWVSSAIGEIKSIKNPLTPAGIEPATFRFVAQQLNHCVTAVPGKANAISLIPKTNILRTIPPDIRWWDINNWTPEPLHSPPTATNTTVHVKYSFMREMDGSGSGQSQVVNNGRSDILTAVAIKITAIGVGVPYGLIEVCRHFGSIYCHHLQRRRNRQYQIILYHIPENGSIQTAGFCKL